MAASTYLGSETTYLSTTRRTDWHWILICGLAFLPVAAILHHGVFFASTCMLNPFGPDYTLQTLAIWLANDPSPTVAAVLVVALWFFGRPVRVLRPVVAVFVLAFLPLALYVWDIPGTSRWVCANFHDLKFALPGDLPLRGRHLYVLGAALYPLIYLTRIARSHVSAGYAVRPAMQQLRATLR